MSTRAAVMLLVRRRRRRPGRWRAAARASVDGGVQAGGGVLGGAWRWSSRSRVQPAARRQRQFLEDGEQRLEARRGRHGLAQRQRAPRRAVVAQGLPGLALRRASRTRDGVGVALGERGGGELGLRPAPRTARWASVAQRGQRRPGSAACLALVVRPGSRWHAAVRALGEGVHVRGGRSAMTGLGGGALALPPSSSSRRTRGQLLLGAVGLGAGRRRRRRRCQGGELAG